MQRRMLLKRLGALPLVRGLPSRLAEATTDTKPASKPVNSCTDIDMLQRYRQAERVTARVSACLVCYDTEADAREFVARKLTPLPGLGDRPC